MKNEQIFINTNEHKITKVSVPAWNEVIWSGAIKRDQHWQTITISPVKGLSDVQMVDAVMQQLNGIKAPVDLTARLQKVETATISRFKA